jgi:hypothetical protein
MDRLTLGGEMDDEIFWNNLGVMGMTKVNRYQKGITQKTGQIIHLVESLPASIIYWKPTEKQCSVFEELCQVECSFCYWIDKVINAIRGAVDWAEIPYHENNIRKPLLTNEDQALSDSIQKVKWSAHMVERRFPSYSDMDLNVVVPVGDVDSTTSVTYLLDHYIIARLENCLDQIQANVNQYESEMS